MTAEQVLDSYAKEYGVSKYASHAEKAGKIYTKGFESGFQTATDMTLTSVYNEIKKELEIADSVGMAEQYKRGYKDALSFLEKRIDMISEKQYNYLL